MLRKHFVFYLSVLVMILSSNAWAQYGKNKVIYFNFHWRLYETKHFDIYYYKGEEKLLKEYSVVAEQAYDDHSKKLNFELTNRVPFIMYRNKREFQQTNIILGSVSEGIGGFSEIVHNRMVLPVDGSREEVRRLIFHELTHIFQYEIIFHNFIGQTINMVPDWFMEGMAAHMEAAWDSFGLLVLRDAVLNGTLPDLMDLQNFANIRNPFLGYRAGQSAVDFMVKKYGYKGLQRLLWEMSKSKTKRMKDMIKKTFGISYHEFNEEWCNSLRKKFWKIGYENLSPSTIGKHFPLDSYDPYHEIQFFQSALSPSGDLLAALSTKRDELDIVLLNAQNGKFIKNLTKNYQGRKYELILGVGQNAGRNLSWSHDGNLLVFVAKWEGKNTIFLLNIITGKIVERIKTKLNDVNSPNFTPDDKKLVFSAIDGDGRSDIFLMDINDKSILRVTNDVFVDQYPIFSPDGNMLVYCSEREKYFQLVLINNFPNGQKILLTNTNYNHISPDWSIDNQKIIFIADENSINNIYELDLLDQKVRQITATYGGFLNPQFSPDGTKIFFDSYFEAKFHTGFMEYPEKSEEFIKQFELSEKTLPCLVPEQKTSAASADIESSDLIAYLNKGKKPAQIEGKKVKFKLLPDAGIVEAQYRTDGIFIAKGLVYFSDILGNHRFAVSIQSIQNNSSLAMSYFNLKHRYDYGVSVFNYKDVTYFVDPQYGDLNQYQSSQIGGQLFLQYPFNRYHRIELSMTGFQYSLSGYPVFDPVSNSYTVSPDYVRNYFPVSLDFTRDTVRYRYFGQYQGSTFKVGVEKAVKLSESYLDYLNFFYDFRAYQRVSRRSLFAFRFIGKNSFGNELPYYSIGGASSLRGYDYDEFVGNNFSILNVEYRFPLIDYLRISFLGTITNIRGTFYLDMGTAWFDKQDVTPWSYEDGFHLVDVKSDIGFGIYWNLGYFDLRFDWARKTDFRKIMGKYIYQFSIGRSF